MPDGQLKSGDAVYARAPSGHNNARDHAKKGAQKIKEKSGEICGGSLQNYVVAYRYLLRQNHIAKGNHNQSLAAYISRACPSNERYFTIKTVQICTVISAHPPQI
ncbi:hypothetical protein KSZ_18060 [Dictyobacter formicarum]|uniref:Uncharacterized protein n=1 Tax=Dictyobacter formicarum TaxID=2778368 RepID=A0ABQ3VCV0_9CHLR|nr:hypothetical protein KSZ_18060 [Dictyobacter formicarum]